MKRKKANAPLTELLACQGEAHRTKRSMKRFTLIELLVVIIIIMILAGMLLPVLSQVRKRAYVTNCRNNLGQFGKAIAMYQGENDGHMPFWLSDLYEDGVSPNVMLCPQDYSVGYDGGRPGGTGDKYTSEQYGDKINAIDDTYPETDDTERGQNDYGDTYWQSRRFANKVKFSSYMYEFAAVECPFTVPGPNPDVSWWEFKNWEFRNSTMTSGKEIQPYEFPVVRCVYHWGVMWGQKEFVQNTAYDGSTFIGSSIWKDGRHD